MPTDDADRVLALIPEEHRQAARAYAAIMLADTMSTMARLTHTAWSEAVAQAQHECEVLSPKVDA